jgi:hypothetical protein
MAEPRPLVPLENIFAEIPEVSALVLAHCRGDILQTLENLRRSGRPLLINEYLNFINQSHEDAKKIYSSEKIKARDNIKSASDLPQCFEITKTYQNTPVFFSVMTDLLEVCIEHFLSPVNTVSSPVNTVSSPVNTMVDMRLLLETYDWKQLCQHIELYQEFRVIVNEFLVYVLNLVTDDTLVFFQIVRTQGGITKKEYFDQNRRIFANMGNAGFVHCIWRVCQYHSTDIPLQAKLLDILYKLIKSPCVRHVRDVLKTPGNMRIIENILANMDGGVPLSKQRSIFEICAANYASLVNVMFLSDTLFTEHEEIQVIAGVHTFIARCLPLQIMTNKTLLTLLHIIGNRVRESTLRQLTDAQIDFLCSDELIRDMAEARLSVSNLIYRAFAAQERYDTTNIDALFKMYHV